MEQTIQVISRDARVSTMEPDGHIAFKSSKALAFTKKIKKNGDEVQTFY